MGGREGKSATDWQASVGNPQEPRSLPCSTRPSRSTPNTLTAPDPATPPPHRHLPRTPPIQPLRTLRFFRFALPSTSPAPLRPDPPTPAPLPPVLPALIYLACRGTVSYTHLTLPTTPYV